MFCSVWLKKAQEVVLNNLFRTLCDCTSHKAKNTCNKEEGKSLRSVELKSGNTSYESDHYIDDIYVGIFPEWFLFESIRKYLRLSKLGGEWNAHYYKSSMDRLKIYERFVIFKNSTLKKTLQIRVLSRHEQNKSFNIFFS